MVLWVIFGVSCRIRQVCHHFRELCCFLAQWVSFRLLFFVAHAYICSCLSVCSLGGDMFLICFRRLGSLFMSSVSLFCSCWFHVSHCSSVMCCAGGFLNRFVKVQVYPAFPEFRYFFIILRMFPIVLDEWLYSASRLFSCCLCISSWVSRCCFPNLFVILLPPPLVIFFYTAIFMAHVCPCICILFRMVVVLLRCVPR